ncbi:universal stress protein [Panacibacter ginsenosidivorans]|uniref:Universal stress protein n=1 Tax=Panacibacter ginsenosidivorans TaxID=1813871 RepID=A0A5B8V519_9BACT|nr:universal stress protein [Panacibacter ginsenosidivorans]QEC66258.1 universal stress protein [Panacibacter ginsenosidivorans]
MTNIKKILIAVDDGPTAEKVALSAFHFAHQLKAEMALVSVVDTASLMSEGGITVGELADIMTKEYKQNHQLLMDKIFKDVKVWSFVEKGKPHEEILKVAQEWEADLIVMGTHGRTGLAHLFMGSVAEKIVRHSEKPLFIIPTRP